MGRVGDVGVAAGAGAPGDRVPGARLDGTHARAGSATDAGRAVLGYVESLGGTAEATLLGDGRRMPVASAALVHGTWVHVHDFDDTIPDSVIHPTGAVAAATLATGEAVGATGEQVLAAAAVGIEVMCRVGSVGGRRFHRRGIHATAVAGPIATALVASEAVRPGP